MPDRVIDNPIVNSPYRPMSATDHSGPPGLTREAVLLNFNLQPTPSGAQRLL
jgi:hypothetical protein